MYRPPSRAADTHALAYRPKEASKPRTPLEKKSPSYVDIAALIATKLGGQEWQTVPPKQKKTPKLSTQGAQDIGLKDLKPAREKDKEVWRLLFQRD